MTEDGLERRGKYGYCKGVRKVGEDVWRGKEI